MPEETRAFVNHITNQKTPVSFLDIHQDGVAKKEGFTPTPSTRSRTFTSYGPVRSSQTCVAHEEVDSSPRERGEKYVTDENGLVGYHDGSSQDLMNRLGVKYTACHLRRALPP
jgi:hypothetical protein